MSHKSNTLPVKPVLTTVTNPLSIHESDGHSDSQFLLLTSPLFHSAVQSGARNAGAVFDRPGNAPIAPRSFSAVC